MAATAGCACACLEGTEEKNRRRREHAELVPDASKTAARGVVERRSRPDSGWKRTEGRKGRDEGVAALALLTRLRPLPRQRARRRLSGGGSVGEMRGRGWRLGRGWGRARALVHLEAARQGERACSSARAQGGAKGHAEKRAEDAGKRLALFVVRLLLPLSLSRLQSCGRFRFAVACA